MPHLPFATILVAASLATSCAILSLLVISRRWAFIGEGISHSGFGGAGTAWMAMLLFPTLSGPQFEWAPFAGIVLFCLGTAGAIGFFTRAGRVNSDAAIGIFMVASLAWGFLAQQIYYQRRHAVPPGGDAVALLFGRSGDVPLTFALIGAMVCVAVVVVVIFLGKEIVSYCFDPAMAEASGLNAGFIHYLLMLLVSLTIVVGIRIVGTVLVTALLVLPGATVLLLSRQLGRAIAGSVAVALAATLAGLVLGHRWPFLPTGPVIVLALFAEFLLAYIVSRTGLSQARGTA